MKSFIATAAALALAISPVACNKSPEGGNPGTKDSFKLSGPTLATSLKQGETKKVDIKLARGSDFKKSVKLETTAPKGIKATITDTVKSSDPEDAVLTIEADKDAPVGDAMPIIVTATPEGGVVTKLEVKVTVTASK